MSEPYNVVMNWGLRLIQNLPEPNIAENEAATSTAIKLATTLKDDIKKCTNAREAHQILYTLWNVCIVAHAIWEFLGDSTLRERYKLLAADWDRLNDVLIQLRRCPERRNNTHLHKAWIAGAKQWLMQTRMNPWTYCWLTDPAEWIATCSACGQPVRGVCPCTVHN